MSVFTDDFERPDGPAGGNWVSGSGVLNISGGYAVGSTIAYVAHRNTTISSPGRHECVVSLTLYPNGTNMAGAVIKVRADGTGGYSATVNYAAPNYTFSIWPSANGVVSPLAQVVLPSAPPGIFTIRLIWDNGTLTATLNDGYELTADNAVSADGIYMGIRTYFSYAKIGSFTAITGTAPELSIDPAVIPNYGECTTVTLTGTDGNWTPGTPGAPIFTVDHGTITAQTVTDGYHATLTYCPGDYLGPVCFTDPSTSTQICTIVTSDPNIAPPTGGLTQDILDYLQRSSVSGPAPTTILNQAVELPEVDIPTDPREALGWLYRSLANLIDPQTPPALASTWIDDLYARLWGGEEWIQASFAPPGTNALKSDTLAILARWLNAVSQTYWTVDELVASIKGLDNRSITQVYDLITAGVPVDLQAVIDLLLAIRGSDTASVAYNELILKDIITLQGYNLQDVKDWIEAVRGNELQDLTAIMSKLQTIQGDEVANLANITQWLDSIYTAVVGTDGKVDALTSNGANSLQTILDAIGAGLNVDLTPVLNAIAALRGDNTSTVKAILDSLTAYRTGNGYTVRDILDAIGQDSTNPNYTVPALIALLLLALMGDGVKLATFVTKLATNKLDFIVDIVGTIIDAADFFLDLWNALRNPAPVQVTGIVPAYPGLEGVTLLDPIPFVDGVNVSLPMDGALIEISVPGEHPYAIRNTQPTRYGRLGTYAFACDVERLESIQPIQYLNMVATPKSIIHPTGIVVQCKPGTVGTVIPYTLAT